MVAMIFFVNIFYISWVTMLATKKIEEIRHNKKRMRLVVLEKNKSRFTIV